MSGAVQYHMVRRLSHTHIKRLLRLSAIHVAEHFATNTSSLTAELNLRKYRGVVTFTAVYAYLTQGAQQLNRLPYDRILEILMQICNTNELKGLDHE